MILEGEKFVGVIEDVVEVSFINVFFEEVSNKELEFVRLVLGLRCVGIIGGGVVLFNRVNNGGSGNGNGELLKCGKYFIGYFLIVFIGVIIGGFIIFFVVWDNGDNVDIILNLNNKVIKVEKVLVDIILDVIKVVDKV